MGPPPSSAAGAATIGEVSNGASLCERRRSGNSESERPSERRFGGVSRGNNGDGVIANNRTELLTAENSQQEKQLRMNGRNCNLRDVLRDAVWAKGGDDPSKEVIAAISVLSRRLELPLATGEPTEIRLLPQALSSLCTLIWHRVLWTVGLREVLPTCLDDSIRAAYRLMRSNDFCFDETAMGASQLYQIQELKTLCLHGTVGEIWRRLFEPDSHFTRWSQSCLPPPWDQYIYGRRLAKDLTADSQTDGIQTNNNNPVEAQETKKSGLAAHIRRGIRILSASQTTASSASVCSVMSWEPGGGESLETNLTSSPHTTTGTSNCCNNGGHLLAHTTSNAHISTNSGAADLDSTCPFPLSSHNLSSPLSNQNLIMDLSFASIIDAIILNFFEPASSDTYDIPLSVFKSFCCVTPVTAPTETGGGSTNSEDEWGWGDFLPQGLEADKSKKKSSSGGERRRTGGAYRNGFWMSDRAELLCEAKIERDTLWREYCNTGLHLCTPPREQEEETAHKRHVDWLQVKDLLKYLDLDLLIYPHAAAHQPYILIELSKTSVVCPVSEFGPTLHVYWHPSMELEFQLKGHRKHQVKMRSVLEWAGSKYLTFEDIFKIIERIGSGSFAHVYLCANKWTDDLCVVKSIEKSRLRQANVYAEIEVLRRVRHPFIVDFQAAFENATTVSIVTERIAGGDLYDQVEKKGLFTEQESKRALRRILDALMELHAKEVIHRDLKTENLMVDDKSDPTTVRMIDFGLAAVIGSDLMSMRCGSPGYVAPEVLEEKPYDTQCDVFSAGIIMYTLLVGTTPFRGKTVREILQKNAQARLNMDGPVWDLISGRAKSILLWMTQRDPSQRCTAAEALGHPWFTCEALRSYPRSLMINNNRQGSSPQCESSCGEGSMSDEDEEISQPSMGIVSLANETRRILSEATGGACHLGLLWNFRRSLPRRPRTFFVSNISWPSPRSKLGLTERRRDPASPSKHRLGGGDNTTTITQIPIAPTVISLAGSSRHRNSSRMEHEDLLQTNLATSTTSSAAVAVSPPTALAVSPPSAQATAAVAAVSPSHAMSPSYPLMSSDTNSAQKTWQRSLTSANNGNVWTDHMMADMRTTQLPPDNNAHTHTNLGHIHTDVAHTPTDVAHTDVAHTDVAHTDRTGTTIADHFLKRLFPKLWNRRQKPDALMEEDPCVRNTHSTGRSHTTTPSHTFQPSIQVAGSTGPHTPLLSHTFHTTATTAALTPSSSAATSQTRVSPPFVPPVLMSHTSSPHNTAADTPALSGSTTTRFMNKRPQNLPITPMMRGARFY